MKSRGVHKVIPVISISLTFFIMSTLGWVICKKRRLEPEFNEFEPRLKSPKPVSIERRLKSCKIENDFKWNQA